MKKTVLVMLMLSCATAFPLSFVITAEDRQWTQLTNDVETARLQLNALIAEADAAGISTEYAEVSELVIRLFQSYAQYDYEHQEDLEENFQKFDYAAQMDPDAAVELPVRELEGCLEVAARSISELEQQLNEALTLTRPPDLSTGSLSLAGAYYKANGSVVFPSSFNSMPKTGELLNAFGRMGGAYYDLTKLQDDGVTVKSWAKNQDFYAGLSDQSAAAIAPQIIFLGHRPANWMKQAYPEIEEATRNFTKYDIDNPHIREWLQALFADLLPWGVAGSSSPRIHLLANEPHFATEVGGWQSSALSDYSMDKYRDWLEEKYGTITALNQMYGTSYADFSEADLAVPVDTGLRGGPVWYDWCRFNMDRVNDWWDFLKTETQANDPSPTTVKIIGGVLTGTGRAHGLDMEYLTDLQEIPGGDLRMLPAGATVYNNEDTSRLDDYTMDWVRHAIVLDFTKSLCPDKMFYDSEWHGFSTVGWRHYDMSAEYVRAALWHAFTHGMGAINAWHWGRNEDGSYHNTGLQGSVLTQPKALDAFGRTMKELNAHADDVADLVPGEDRRFMIFYNEECAIQSGEYIEHMTTVYEALKLINVSVGFTTPSRIEDLAEDQIVVVPPMPYISDSSLQKLSDFEGGGGKIVLLNATDCFTHDEMGSLRNNSLLTNWYASVAMDSAWNLAAGLDAVLQPLKPRESFDVVTTNNAYGVFMTQYQDAADTNTVKVCFINTSNVDRTATLSLYETGMLSVEDLITGQMLSHEIALAPNAVKLLRVTRN